VYTIGVGTNGTAPYPMQTYAGVQYVQMLVIHDMIGLTMDFSPRFLRRYANVQQIMHEAIGHYVEDVKSGDFPNEKEQY
jgi:ketopantoate hydroxymethyltransferase